MSKGHDGAEKQKEAPHKEGGEAKKQGEAKHHDAPRSGKSKGNAAMPGGCLSWGCKAEGKQFNFCPEHYDHFKFGLIKKTGEPVSDYEKKFGHYMAHKAKKGSQRVA